MTRHVSRRIGVYAQDKDTIPCPSVNTIGRTSWAFEEKENLHVDILWLASQLDFECWNNNHSDFVIADQRRQFCFDPMIKVVCGVWTAHNKATYITSYLNAPPHLNSVFNLKVNILQLCAWAWAKAKQAMWDPWIGMPSMA